LADLPSNLKSSGDYFFYFFAKKYLKKVTKSTKSKHGVFLMKLEHIDIDEAVHWPSPQP